LPSGGEEEKGEDAVENVEMDESQTVPQAEDVEMRDINTPPPLELKPLKERRPKKKRRKETEQPDIAEIIEAPQTPPATNDAVEVPPSVPVDTYIPSFPLPSQPAIASKAQRTLQGMDSAMVDAEIVDPTITTGLDIDKESIGKHLSPRMLKRLADIGVTELFAGESNEHSANVTKNQYFSVQTKLIPFLLPEDEDERALYQPYNPPRDVCASAPTGSGKTLAYVVPIVEVWYLA
jgi:ATP-dependent RNA helicase DDX51/DBP6